MKYMPHILNKYDASDSILINLKFGILKIWKVAGHFIEEISNTRYHSLPPNLKCSPKVSEQILNMCSFSRMNQIGKLRLDDLSSRYLEF